MSNSAAPGRLTAAIELLVFVAIALGLRQAFDPFFWRYAGPVSLLTTLGLLTLYMRYRGENWSSMGLIPLPGWRAKLMLIPQTLLTFAAFCAILAPIFLGAEALGLEFMAERPAGVEDRWGDVRGSLPHLLLWLAIVWTAAAFGEEMFFRGFLITRMMSVVKGIPFGAVIAVVLPALLFGYGHMYYQGLRGLITTGAIAIAFGTMFLLMKRNLWPIILLHGIIDTIGFMVIYLGIE